MMTLSGESSIPTCSRSDVSLTLPDQIEKVLALTQACRKEGIWTYVAGPAGARLPLARIGI